MDDEGVISFAHGEGLRRPHPSVVAAGVRALTDPRRAPLERYLFKQGNRELDSLVYSSFIRIGVPARNARNIAIASGTTPLMWAFLATVVGREKIVLVGPGYYHAIAGWCSFLDVELRLVPTTLENDYKLRPQDLLDWWQQNPDSASRVAALILFNPTPYGAIYSTDELEGIADLARYFDFWILDDAIFAGTEFNGDSSPRASASMNARDRTLTVNGGSKSLGLANLRIGWACGPRDLVETICAYVEAANPTVPELTKLMAIAALRAPQDYLAENRIELRSRARLTAAILRDAGEAGNSHGRPRVLVDPQAGHSLIFSSEWPGWGPREPSSIDVTHYLLRVAAVAVSPGWSCGFPRSVIRLNFASVGMGATYDEARRAEREAILASTGDRPGTEILGLDAGQPQSVSSTKSSGFAEGRRLIIEGLQNRAMPALRDSAFQAS